jgi:imidazolonepropionase-like amidohydrolase
MTRILRHALVAGAVVIAGGAAAGQPPAPEADLVVRGGWLFDAVRDAVGPNPGVAVRHGRIVRVGSLSGGEREIAGARVIELAPDEYVLPGFFDLHAHYAVDLFGEGRVDEYTVNPIVFLANGVTSTFPAGEVDPEGMRAARERIDAGRQIGARIYNSGPYFGTARPGWDPAVMTPERIRAEVDEWAAKGARGFKAKGIRPDQLAALIDQAHRHGLTVTGHLDSGFRASVNPRDAIGLGIDRIEHFLGGDAITADRPAYASLERLDADRGEVASVIRLYLDRRVYFDATLSAYGYFGEREPAVFDRWADEMGFLTAYARAVVEKRTRRINEQFERIYRVKRQTIKRFYDAGGAGLITLGTDHPSWGEFLSGFAVHRELHSLVLAGIPPAAALKIATINGARALGVDGRLGTIEPGKLADLVVIRGNPLDDIRATRRVRLVVKSGQVFEADALLAGVRGSLGPTGSGDEPWWKGRLRFGRASDRPM